MKTLKICLFVSNPVTRGEEESADSPLQPLSQSSQQLPWPWLPSYFHLFTALTIILMCALLKLGRQACPVGLLSLPHYTQEADGSEVLSVRQPSTWLRNSQAVVCVYLVVLSASSTEVSVVSSTWNGPDHL